MTKKIKISNTNSNPEIEKRVQASIDKKKVINEYIREGKDLKKLNERGIRFRLPV